MIKSDTQAIPPGAQKEPRQGQGHFGEVGRYPQEPKIARASPRVLSNVGSLGLSCGCGRRATKRHGWLELQQNTATRRLCGIARVPVPFAVLHALGQYQTSELFFGISRTCGGIVFYTHWVRIGLARCFCGSVRIHIFHCVLNPLVQYQPSELLLRDCAHSCSFCVLLALGQ